MSRVVYYAAMTLDGYIADLDENLEWLTKFDGPGYAGEAASEGPMESSYKEFYEGVGALVMGSKTYEFILPYDWMYGDKPTWVLTSRELPAIDGASGLRFSSGAVAEIHDEMIEAAGGRDLWVLGGGNVATQYVEAGLLDVLQVTIVPVVLGAGLPLFAGPVPPMKLLDVVPYGNGMTELTYELAGAARTGSAEATGSSE